MNPEDKKNKSPKLCFGTWGIAGSTPKSPAYGAVEINNSKKILEAAVFDYGIDFFDTSPSYSEGKAEELLGWLNKKKNLKVCTKVGRQNLTDIPDWEIRSSKFSIEGSMKRLKKDYLEMVSIHSPDINDIEKIKYLAEFLFSLKEDGLIGKIGISLKAPSDWEIFRNLEFSFVQVNFNLLDVRSLKYFAEWDFNKIEILARGPFASGILTNSQINFEDKIDHRSRWNIGLRASLFENRKKLIEKFPSISIDELDKVSLQFVYSFKSISYIVISILTLQELQKNVFSLKSVWPDKINRNELIDAALSFS